MDGARLFYAAAATGKNLRELTTDLGVDIVFLGGSKGGMHAAEATIFTPNFFRNVRQYGYDGAAQDLLREVRSYAKQYGLNMGQAVGAMAQFIFAFSENHAVNLARTAITQAHKLDEALRSIPGVELYCPTETNAVMVTMPKEMAQAIAKQYHLMTFTNRPLPPEKEGSVVVRFMTTGATTDAQIEQLKRDMMSLQKERTVGSFTMMA
jgi:threonine aldolase